MTENKRVRFLAQKRIILLILCVTLLVPVGKTQKITIKEIKKKNQEYYGKENQVIKITRLNKTRYISDLSISRQLIYLGSYNQNYRDFSFIDSFYNMYFKVSNDSFFYKNRDSATFKLFEVYNMPLDIGNWKIPNELDDRTGINYLPLERNFTFFSKKFNSGYVVYQSKHNDTIVYRQKDKKKKIQRNLYLDNNLRIFKIEYFDLNEDDLTERWTVYLKVFPNSLLNGIADSLDFGPFAKRLPKVQKPPLKLEADTFKFNVFPLINGNTINVDTVKTRFYLIDFWYLECYPCHLFRPECENLYDKVDTNRVKFFGFNQYNKVLDVKKYIEIKSYQIPEIDRATFKLNQFSYIHKHPTLLILDKHLNVVKEIVGFSKENLKILNDFLETEMLLK